MEDTFLVYYYYYYYYYYIAATHSFPFVKKRIEVNNKTECILSPLEVAIDEMNAKVADLREVVDLAMPDMKKLQLKLQGSVSAQVPFNS